MSLSVLVPSPDTPAGPARDTPAGSARQAPAAGGIPLPGGGTWRPPPDTVAVLLELTPNQPSTVVVAVADEPLTELVRLCYHVGGPELVDDLMRDLSRPARYGQLLVDPVREKAIGLANEATKDLRDDVVEALHAVDWEVRHVFQEVLDQARAAIRLSRYGFIDMPTDAAREPILDFKPPGDGPLRFKGLRRAVADLDTAARAFAEEDRLLRPLGDLPGPSGYAGEKAEQWRAAREGFVTAWTAAVGRYPVLAVCGARLLEQTTSKLTGREVEDHTKSEGSFDNPLDRMIRSAVRDTWRTTTNAGSDLLAAHLQAAEHARLESLRPEFRPEQVYAHQHPLWRYPFLVRAALERLDAGPGTIEYATAIHTLHLAAEVARLDRAQARLVDDLLAWASLGFGIVSLVPVIGVVAALAADACNITIATRHVLAYVTARRDRDAFGPLAAGLGIPDPDGTGVVFEVLGAGAGLVAGPLLGVIGRQAGRLLRFAALEKQLIWLTPALVAGQLALLADAVAEQAKRSAEMAELNAAEAAGTDPGEDGP